MVKSEAYRDAEIFSFGKSEPDVGVNGKKHGQKKVLKVIPFFGTFSGRTEPFHLIFNRIFGIFGMESILYLNILGN